jgi:hypothetical protein
MRQADAKSQAGVAAVQQCCWLAGKAAAAGLAHVAAVRGEAFPAHAWLRSSNQETCTELPPWPAQLHMHTRARRRAHLLLRRLKVHSVDLLAVHGDPPAGSGGGCGGGAGSQVHEVQRAVVVAQQRGAACTGQGTHRARTHLNEGTTDRQGRECCRANSGCALPSARSGGGLLAGAWLAATLPARLSAVYVAGRLTHRPSPVTSMQLYSASSDDTTSSAGRAGQAGRQAGVAGRQRRQGKLRFRAEYTHRLACQPP